MSSQDPMTSQEHQHTDEHPDDSPSAHHPLLARQLDRWAIVAEPPSAEQWADFVDRVERSYVEADRAQRLVEQTLDVSAREFATMYEQLQVQTSQVLTSERHRLQ
ncbi:hypothetical protein, partial [Mesomycoplasma ovipneumoniae]|uniref:hypothetical protein n=1 Tax=Mesomycoplasma ovipneumoniae TaxID=29562 RepID=UPI003080B4B4